MPDSPGPTLTDCIPLMQQLARMANMDLAKISRMVLVLDVRDIPRLFTEGFLVKDKQEDLVVTDLVVAEGPVIIDTTTMQNRQFTTKQEIGDAGP